MKSSIKLVKMLENPSSDYFSRVGKIVKTGLGVECHIPDYDYRLSYGALSCEDSYSRKTAHPRTTCHSREGGERESGRLRGFFTGDLLRS